MIVYGWKNRKSKDFELKHSKCEACGETGKTGTISHNYAHIYWIPLFPYKKIIETQCQHCEAVLQGDLPPADELQMEQQTGGSKPPLLLFIGSAIVAVLIAGIALYAQNSSAQQLEMAQNPQVGDLYIVKDIEPDMEYPYAMLQLFRVGPDSVNGFFSSWVYDQTSGFTKDISSNKHLDTAYWVTDYYYTFARAELLAWESSNKAKDIIRGEPITADTTFASVDINALLGLDLDSLFLTADTTGTDTLELEIDADDL